MDMLLGTRVTASFLVLELFFGCLARRIHDMDMLLGTRVTASFLRYEYELLRFITNSVSSMNKYFDSTTRCVHPTTLCVALFLFIVTSDSSDCLRFF
eukprot:scaffold9122_cov94-Cylindrotheca_fusiformis.AAC.2